MPLVKTYLDKSTFHGQPNTSDAPDESGGIAVAARDIALGKELTCDYAEIDVDYAGDQNHR